MKTSTEGFQQCYNAQVAVDGEHQIIVATTVSAEASDQGQMLGLLEEVEETFEETPTQVLADAGYCNEADLQELEARRVDGYIALGREGKRAVEVDPGKHPARSRMRKKLASLAGQVEYRRRKWIAEAPMTGSRRGSDFDGSACGACSQYKESGTWCVWPSTSRG